MSTPQDPIRPGLTEWRCRLDDVDYVCGYYIDQDGKPFMDQITVGGYDMAGILAQLVIDQLFEDMVAKLRAAGAEDTLSQEISWAMDAREAA